MVYFWIEIPVYFWGEINTIVQHGMKLERSIYEVLQILGISLTDKTHCNLPYL